VVATAGAFALWGLFPLYWKLTAHLPATEVLSHRITWSLPCLAALLALRGRGPELRRALGSPRTRLLLLASTVFITANWLTFIWAVNNDRVLDASLGYYINPLVSVLLGFVFLGERFSFGSYGLVRKVADVPGMVGLFVEVALLAPLTVGYLLWLRAKGEGAFAAGQVGLDLILVAAGLVTVVPLLLFAEGVRRLTLATVGFLQYMTPTGHFLLAVAVFGEPFDALHLVAFALIWTALALYTFDLRRHLRGALPKPLSPRE
jgi:chloramphenicol-sensitive protein RarD